MTVWSDEAAWFKPVLGIERVADVLDIQPASVRRYLTDHSGFPEPADQRANRNFWTPTAIYRHIWNTKPQSRQHIPRLCPLTDNIGPARFVESEIIHHRWHTYVLHTWEPGDQRGPVGVAYCKDFERGDDDAARELLSLRPHLSAVTLAQGTVGLQSPRQPRITVADSAGTDWYPWELGWSDLTALLQVDLPWWSQGLTDVEAIHAWRPGTPIAEIRPHAADFTAEHFERCRPRDGSPADQALAELAAATDRTLAEAFDLWPDGHDDFPNRPGLRHAAIAAIEPDLPAAVSPATIADALHHRVDDGLRAIRAVQTGRSFGGVLYPAITHALLTIDPTRCSRLAQEWCQRLTEVDPAHANEIGYHWVAYAMDDKQPCRWWRDPLNAAVWAISDADGVIHTTLGTRVPARGRLEEFAVEDHHPFFCDSAGNSFPVPSADGTAHSTRGSSATRLTATILALMDDAARDVYYVDRGCDVLDTRATGLYEAVCTSEDGTVLYRRELEGLREETPQGAARRADVLARYRGVAG